MGLTARSVQDVKPFSTVLPEVHENSTLLPNPCTNHSMGAVNVSEVINRISCAARNNNIYVLINLLEAEKIRDESYFYNTDVVFNRDGAIVAK